MRRSVGMLLVVGTLVSFGPIGGPANAVIPGRNGRILYTHGVFLANDVSYQLEAADPDGSNIVVLARFGGNAFGDEMFANWSPDGASVLLNIYDAVWEVNADGSDLHELISCSSPGVRCGRHGGFGPATFTPDGEHILVEHCCTDPEGLYTLNADGSGLTAMGTGQAFSSSRAGYFPDARRPIDSPRHVDMEIRRELPASPAAGSLARDALDGWLTDLVGVETAANVRLAASELVDNAVLHAGLTETDTIRLSGLATKDIVRIEVEQPSSTKDVHVVAVDEDSGRGGGFGLRIVEAVASDWGVRADAPGAVWFEVDRDLRDGGL